MLEIYTDGACRGNPGQCGIGITAVKNGTTVFEVSEHIGKGTNNTAEYFALIRGLEETLIKGFTEARFMADSELLVEQINGRYKVKNEQLRLLFFQARSLIGRFKTFKITHIAREKNKRADALANLALDQSEQ